MMTVIEEDRLEPVTEGRILNGQGLASMYRKNAREHVAELSEWIARYGVGGVLHAVAAACLERAADTIAECTSDEDDPAWDYRRAAVTVSRIADGFGAEFAQAVDAARHKH